MLFQSDTSSVDVAVTEIEDLLLRMDHDNQNTDSFIRNLVRPMEFFMRNTPYYPYINKRLPGCRSDLDFLDVEVDVFGHLMHLFEVRRLSWLRFSCD
jgi:hypothetical protein